MSFNNQLREKLLPVVPIVEPNIYKGDALEYIDFAYSERGGCFGDDEPDENILSVQVHYYLPHGQNPKAKKRLIRQALFELGGTWPEITNASDEEGQHYVFEFDCVEENDDGQL